MNNTNRGANRLVILVVGLVALAVGAGGVLIGVLGTVRSGWRATAPTVGTNVDDAFDSATIPGTTASWLSVAAVAALVVLIVLFLVFIFRQGHGHTGDLIRSEAGEHGGVAIDAKFAEQALANTLDDDADLVASHVSTYDVRNSPVLKVSVTCRRGVSPADVAASIDSALGSLDRLLGQEAHAFVQISGGFRARTAKATRVE